MMATQEQIPKYHELLNPLLRALHELGGSGSIEEIPAKAAEVLNLPDEVLSVPQDAAAKTQSSMILTPKTDRR